MRRSRWWLALAYVLAAVGAPVQHDHGEREDSAHHCLESCQGPIPYVTGHGGSGHKPDLSHCLACQYRTSAPGWPSLVSVPLQPHVALVFDPSDRAIQPRSTFLPPCRAPPRA